MKKGKYILLGILLLAIFFRFQNINWDLGFHLHPDERFLTMVGNSMKLPSSWEEYITPHTSTFNPVNVGYSFFVYGVFPLILNKVLALMFQTDTYMLFTLQGRLLSGIFDMLTLILVYKSAQLIARKHKHSSSIALWAAFIYGGMVLPIQLSHFFATDTFLNFFMFASFYFALRFFYKGHYFNIVYSAIMLGFGIATKANAVYILPLILFFFSVHYIKKRQFGDLGKAFFVFLAILYAVVRLAEPYYFETSNFFNPSPSKLFIQNIQILKSFEGREVMYPPSIQWINTRPLLFSLFNMCLFGIGIISSALSYFGIFQLLFKRRKLEIIVIIGWVLGVFIFQSVQFVKVLRYFIFLYPFFSIFAGYGAEAIVGFFSKRSQGLRGIIVPIVVVLCLVWPFAFTSIYQAEHTRVQATKWIFQHVKTGSLILSEYWDDALPLYQDKAAGYNYAVEQIAVFDPESDEKWQKINSQLKKADYYILSSNRGWGSIPTVPDRFPTTTDFYKSLFANKRGYELQASFYPSYYPCRLFHVDCPRFLSDWFDESFTVYDHPTVYIFKNEKSN